MNDFMAQARADPSPGNCAFAGMVLAGVVGALIGLAVGLNVYAGTAWAAMLELGLPAAVAGAAIGFLVGCALTLAKRFRRHESL